MANTSAVRLAALSSLLLGGSIDAWAGEEPAGITLLLAQSATSHPNIVTSRLSPKHLSLWNSLLRTVQARDNNGVPLYPRLNSLYVTVVESGHAVYIELIEGQGPANMYHVAAGKFIREKIGQDGRIRPAVIRLYLYVIDHAKSDPEKDKFERFKGLRSDERYLVILGHELAHAATAFRDQDYAQKLQDLERAAADLLAFRRSHPKPRPSFEEMQRRANQVHVLVEAIEAPAWAAEIEVWRELSRNRTDQSAEHLKTGRNRQR